MCHRKRMIAGLAIALLGMAALIQATVTQAAVVDYNIVAPTTGSISFAGGNTALVGMDISVDSLIGLDGMPANGNTTLNCVNCTLNFTTGNYYGSQTVNNITEWLFNGGGTITLTGSVTDSNNNAIVTNSTLFSGMFTGAATLQLSTTIFTLSVAAGAFNGQNNADLLSYFGLPAGFTGANGGMLIGFMPVGSPTVGSGFSSSAISSGLISNTVVPIPAAVWLFISGLLGMGLTRRRNSTV